VDLWTGGLQDGLPESSVQGPGSLITFQLKTQGDGGGSLHQVEARGQGWVRGYT
jgi:hypothetical protein